MSFSKIEQKVAKLLALAEDQQGTPEGAAFQEKAFALMAQYAIDEHKVRQASGQGPAEIIQRTVVITGSYKHSQLDLLGALVRSLHCYSVYRTVASRDLEVTIFGCAAHVDRVEFLFRRLTVAMFNESAAHIADAKAAMAGQIRIGEMTVELSVSASEVRVMRRSFFDGFIAQIATRLSAVEKEHSDQFATATQSGELVLLDDAARAEQAARSRFAHLRSRKRNTRSMDYSSVIAGTQCADQMDIGQTPIRSLRQLFAAV